MSLDSVNRRSEARFEIGTEAVLRYHQGAEGHPAVTVNVSTGGILLELTGNNPFQVGEQIICEAAMPQGAEEAFSEWASGEVVRADGHHVALQFQSGIFVN